MTEDDKLMQALIDSIVYYKIIGLYKPLICKDDPGEDQSVVDDLLRKKPAPLICED